MLILHHLQVSQSERITWLLEELSLAYKLVIHTRDPMLSPPSLRSVPGNATGKAPFLEDPEAGITLSESAAIVEYIINVYGNGRFSLKPGDKNYSDYLYWFHHANGTLQTEMIANMFLEGSGVEGANEMVGFARGRLDAVWRHLDERLGECRYLVGEEFTAADVMTVYSVGTQRYFGPQDDISGYANLCRWLSEVTGREAFKRAMEKADPDMKVLNEGRAPGNLMKAGGVISDIWKK